MYTFLQKKASEYFDEAVEIRRTLHQCPEPCFKENLTSQFIARYLRELGLDVRTGIAGTGIKAVLKGAKAKPVVAIRADMDALPLEEKTGLEFLSKNKGFMHACGHDAHITNGLIAAKILSGMKDSLPGTVVFIFQPCEEGTPDGSPQGAELMVGEGVLKKPKVDAVVGLHVMPGYPVGSVAIKEGPVMANVATAFITIEGKSSHGAFPHQGVDAIYAASSAVMQFQALISRFKDPNEPAVFSIGTIRGGKRFNVIASKVEMEGTIRTFSFETQDLIQKGIRDILKGLQISMGITYDFQFKKNAQFVKNDPQLVKRVAPALRQILGDEKVLDAVPVTIGEDFAFYSHRVPSLFFFLGTGEKGKLHTPDFTIDEEVLRFGPQVLAGAALQIMLTQAAKKMEGKKVRR